MQANPPVESVQFYSGGHRLAGYLYKPDLTQVPHSRPAVILCGGLGSIKEMILPPIAAFLTRLGYVALSFDYRGFGESEGPRFRLIPSEQVQDVRSALTFVASLDAVDADAVCLYGNSFGAANAIYAASADERVCAVVSVVGVGNGRRWLQSLRPMWQWRDFLGELEADRRKRVLVGDGDWVEPDLIMPADPGSQEWHRQVLAQFPQRAYRLPLETASEILECAPEAVVDRIAPRPILFVLAEDDVLVAPEQTLAMYERAAEPKELVRLSGAAHHEATGGPRLDEVLDSVGLWLRRYLPIAPCAAENARVRQ